MKKTVLGLGVVASACMAYAAQVTSVWQGGATATTPLTAANWNDPANWDENGVPNGPDAIADFGTQSGVFYVTSAVPVSVWAQKAGSAGGFTFVSEEKFSICNKVSVAPQGGHFYAPVEFQYDNAQTYFSQARFCDVMTGGMSKSALINGLVFYHLDRFARTSGPVRNEALDFNVFGYNARFDIYAPESSATDVVCTFDQSAGSAILKRVGGSVSTVLPVGTTVTGEGVPVGTYLKRVFPNKEWIELSQPVTADATANELTFAAFTPDLTLKLRLIQSNSSGTRYALRPCKYRPEDDFTVDVAEVALLAPYSNGSDQSTIFDTPYGVRIESPDKITSYAEAKYDVQYDTTLYPARVVIHNGGTVVRGTALLADCDLLFSRNPSGTMTPGFSRGVVAQLPLKERNNIPFEESKLTVTGSMTAVIHELKGIWATLGKYGSGTLIVGMTNAAPSTGTIAVREGTFRIADPGEGNVYYCAANDEGPVEIGSLEVAAGATFVVPARGVRLLGSFKAEQGAIIDGEGVISLPESVDLATCGAIFRGKARLGFYGIKLVGTGDHSQVPGNPAFWVDCSQTNTMTLVDVDGELGVERINDVRKKSDDDGYNYSTAVGGFLPRLHYDKVSGKHFVYFLGNSKVFSPSETAGLQDCDTHAWHVPVQKIRAVFQVMSQLRDGANEKNKYGLANMTRGGLFLGACYPATKPGNDNTWGRYSVAYSSPFVEKSWTAAMTNASWFVNGSENVGLAAGYPYPSYVENGEIQLVPATIGYHMPAGTTGGYSASAYDHNVQYQNQNKNGNKILCELIVYTTDVSEADRKQITAYLMKKWQNAEIYARDFQSDGQSLGSLSGSSSVALDVAEDGGMLVDALAGEATIVKAGAGRLRVGQVTGANATLEIRDGTVEIDSKTLDSLPVTEGVYAHFDAENPASLTCDVVGGVSNVTAWADVRGEGPVATIHETSTVRPKLRPQTALGGKLVVDFGNASKKAGADADFSSSPSLLIPAKDRSERLHTVIALWGSVYGGGCLVGGSTGRDMDWSTRYTLARGGAANTYLGGQLNAGIVDSKMAIPYTCQLAKGVDFRLNGVATSHTALDVLKGGFDIATYAGYEAFGMGGFSGVFGSDVYYYGGEQFGEYVAFERKLAPEDVADIEAYLRKKWFGTETPGYGATALKGLSLGPDATLKVRGNAPVTVSGTLGVAGGEVDGALALASGVALEAAVDESGAVQGLTVSGGLDFPAAGTVTLVGALDALLPGAYTLLEAATPIASAAGWTVDATGVRKRYVYTLSVKDGKLMLNVSKPGMLLLVR